MNENERVENAVSAVTNMDDVCAKLDDNVMQIFQVLEDLYSEQEKLQQVMKDGFLGISRSRYLLGVKWVSVDQILDANLTAKFTTVVDDSVVKEGSTLTAVDDSFKTSEIDKLTVFKLSDAMADVYIDKKDDVNEILLDSVTDRQTSLRKRHTDNVDSQHSPPQDNTEKDSYLSKNSKKIDEVPDVTKIKKEGSSKTLSLFGVLAPQPLRTGQKCFEDGIKIAVKLADLKWKLLFLQSEYRRLRKIKENLADEQ